jgi:hypothetical protein
MNHWTTSPLVVKLIRGVDDASCEEIPNAIHAACRKGLRVKRASLGDQQNNLHARLHR